MRTFLFLFMCISLVLGGVANAATPCCCLGKQAAQKGAQADTAEADSMPCHKQQSSDKKSEHAGCKSCKCLHCGKISALPLQFLPVAMPLADHPEALGRSLASIRPESLFQPPRPLS